VKGGRSSAGCRGKVVANLFFEPSTTTRSSFEIAPRRFGAHVLNWTGGLAASKASRCSTP